MLGNIGYSKADICFLTAQSMDIPVSKMSTTFCKGNLRRQNPDANARIFEQLGLADPQPASRRADSV